MKKKIFLIFFALLFSTQVFAAKFSAREGEIVENEVSFGKDKFPLPPGKFTVAVIKKWTHFRDVLLVQIDEDTGVVRWKIKLMATGLTNEKYSEWVSSEMCDESNRYFIKVKKGSKRFACWMISHSTSEGEDLTRISISNNFFSKDQRVYHKMGANQGIWEKIMDYENANNINSPDMFVVSRHHYANKSRLYESEYYYNPELDGVPKPENLDWDKNEFHKNKIRNFPKHEEFLKNFIGISAKLIDRFNELNKVRGGLTLNPQADFVQTSAKVEKKSTIKKDIVNQIKSLKELLDIGAITQDEFDKAKKKILN
jgi:hypothetical protein